MFEQIMAAMNKPTAQNGLDYTQRIMECTLRLTQAQMDVMKELCDEISQEFSKTITSSSDQSAMARSWPQLMSSATRANAEAGALFMKNAKEYQSEVLQMMQDSSSAFSRQEMEDTGGLAKTSSIANGGAALKAARAKKAA